jgi:ketosteroid isomerase-like protein
LSDAVELVRRSVEAFNRRDRGLVDEFWSEDAVVDWSRSIGLEPRVYMGRAEILRFSEKFWELFPEVRNELIGDPVEVRPGVVVAEFVSHVRGREGVEAEAHGAWLITVEGAKQSSLTLYQTKAEALEAAGG